MKAKRMNEASKGAKRKTTRIGDGRGRSDVYDSLRDGVEDLAELGERHGMSPQDLARWAARPRAAAAIQEQRWFAQQRAQLIIANGKAEAARALVNLARSAEHPETARKACIDLLRMEDVIAGGAEPSDTNERAVRTDISAGDVRKALEEMGKN